jgi:hypothetical protein
MKDSFTLDEFILFSTQFGSNGESEMVEERSKALERVPMGPDKRIIDNIMNYSRALSVLKTKGAGNISLLLN